MRIWKFVGTWSALLGPSIYAVACNVFQPPPDLDADTPGGDARVPDVMTMGETGGSSSGVDATVDVMPDTGADVAKESATAIDAGMDGPQFGGDGSTQPWWPYTNSHGCMSAGVPLKSDRPSRSDPSNGDLPPIYLAISRFREGSANNDMAATTNYNAWEDIGFDTDGVCTNSATCADPSDPSGQTFINDPGCQNSQVVPYDGNLCRDNALGRSFGIAAQNQIGEWFGFTEQDIDCELLRGAISIIFKISGYNGQLNDTSVRVDMYQSLGLVHLPQYVCRQTIDSPLDPNWDKFAPWLSTDPWIVDSRSIDLAATDAGSDLPNASINDTGGYVRNGWLVMHLLPDGAPFWFDAERTSVGINAQPGQFPGFMSHMYRSVFAGRLAKGPDGFWTITNGTIAWAEPANDIMQGFRNMGFCENMCQGYNQLKNYLNLYLDTVITAPDETALPSTPCDSLSGGFGIEMRQCAASPADMRPSTLPVDCPQPLSSLAPRQGCNCDGGCLGGEAGTGMDAGVDAGGDAAPDGSNDSGGD
jgi:hypothetical protein